MGHVAILAKPVVFVLLRIEEVAIPIKDSSCRHLSSSLLIHDLLSFEKVAVLIVWLTLIVDEEVDASCQEVYSRGL